MFTLMLGTVVLALTYGAFWHNQPARTRESEKQDQALPPAGSMNRVVAWLNNIADFKPPWL